MKPRHTETTCLDRSPAKEVTMAEAGEPLCIIKEEELDLDEVDNIGCGSVDFATTSNLSVDANRMNYLELGDASEKLQGETTSSQMDTKDDIPRDPLGESDSDCSDTGDGEITKDFKVFCEFSQERQANALDSDVDSNSSSKNLPSRSNFVLVSGPCHGGRHSYHLPQCVDGPDDTAPNQDDKISTIDECSSNQRSEMLNNTGEKLFKCEMCSKSFSHLYQMRRHMFTHSGDKSFKCNICSKSFSRNSSLRTHMLIHTGEKPFKCNMCTKSFTQSAHLRAHMLTHTGEKPFKCNICLKSFSQRSKLREHTLTHTGGKEKLFKCNICSKSFSHNYTLRTHILTHTGEKPFKCNICSKSFSKTYNLRTHMFTHATEKPYKCDICLKSFCTKVNFCSHLRTHMEGKP